MNPGEFAVQFFPSVLTHTKAPYSRESFVLEEWQSEHIQKIFGTLDEKGRRKYKTIWLEVGKKNGKSELGAGIAVFSLVMALRNNDQGFEVYSCAATRAQASLVFGVAAQMIRNSSFLTDQFRVIDSTKTILAKSDITTFYKALSADADINDGVNPCVCIFDEVHRQKTSELWNVMQYGMVTRDQPLMIGLTTAGIESDSPLAWDKHCYAMDLRRGLTHDESFYPIVYGLDENDDWKDEQNWYKANPGLERFDSAGKKVSGFKKIETMREHFQEALRIPRLENDFRRLHLNQWVGQETRWLPLELWKKCEKPFNVWDFKGEKCFAGLDLSTTVDISALVFVFAKGDTVFVHPYFWMPEETLRERSIKDRVAYESWAKAGLIEVTPGNVIDYQFIRKKINDLAGVFRIREIAYDPWNATQIITELDGDGHTMVPVRQGFASLSPPSKAFEAAVLGQKIQHDGNPVLSWMVDCVSVKSDPSGNIRPVKPDRTQSRKRIDGVVALIMALDRLTRNGPAFKSIYAIPETAVM